MPPEQADGETVDAKFVRVNASYFDSKSVRAYMGRVLLESDADGDEATFVASFEFYESALGGTPQAIGASYQIDGVEHTLVGVLPEGEFGPESPDVWLLALDNDEQ